MALSLESGYGVMKGLPCRLVGVSVMRERTDKGERGKEIGVTYDVIFPVDQYAHLSVKVEGSLTPVVEQGVLDKANAEEKAIYVKFTGAVVKPYASENFVKYTATANGVELVKQ